VICSYCRGWGVHYSAYDRGLVPCASCRGYGTDPNLVSESDMHPKDRE
jgi:hypothetical protein